MERVDPKERLYTRMRLWEFTDQYVVEPTEGSSASCLAISRVDGSMKLIDELPQFKSINPQRSRTIFGVLGILKLLQGLYLLVITEHECVGSYLGYPIFKVSSLKVLACDHSLRSSPIEQKKIETEFSMLLNAAERTSGLYFSYDVNLTVSAQQLHDLGEESKMLPLWRQADPKFVWNNYMLESLIDNKLHQYLLPVIQGSFQNFQAAIGKNTIDVTLIARRCTRGTASTVDPYSDYNSMDEALILKKKSQGISPYLSGRCIYLVGMMGSGKSTVGKILAEVLGYSFLDSDNLVEQAVGATSVAQIFKQYSEGFFRDNESKVLGELSLMRRLVVATGGGAVIRPINWKYMKKGISVWLDVPLEALARRIAAVGTNSRPLLHNESGDAYTTAYKRLTVLSEERGEVYANADAKVCLQRIARKLGLGDVSKLSPTAIAIEVLVQIEGFVEDEEEDAETLERNF